MNEVLTGEIPFAAKSIPEILMMTRDGIRPVSIDAERLSGDAVRVDLCECIRRCWASSPLERPSASGVLRTLRVCLHLAGKDPRSLTAEDVRKLRANTDAEEFDDIPLTAAETSVLSTSDMKAISTAATDSSGGHSSYIPSISGNTFFVDYSEYM